MEERLRRWRLILGAQAEEGEPVRLEPGDAGIDELLEVLYDGDQKGGLGDSRPQLHRWLGDIRKYFPQPVVQLMQRDALEKLELHQILEEPELLDNLEPDPQLVGTILSLQQALPAEARETARALVRKLVRELEERLRAPLREAIAGSLQKATRSRRPKLQEINWDRTIRANLKHYLPEHQTVIPHRLIGHGRRGPELKHLILLIDQSESMATSVIHAGVAGCLLASMASLRTQIVAFDTQVVDLTDLAEDPVDLLFGTQLGGGTDIFQALNYAQQLISQPRDTILFLISDLFEGGDYSRLLAKVHEVQQTGLQFICLLALSNQGAPAFDQSVAKGFAQLEIPAFACTPDQFPDLLAAAIKNEDISNWLNRSGLTRKN